MIGRRSVVILAARLISSALAFVGVFFITRYFGSDGYGQIAGTLALVATFAAVADLGFGSAHIKRISEGQDIDDCVSTFAAVKLALIAIFVMLTLSSLAVWTMVLGGKISSDTLSLILLFLLYNVLYQLSAIATTTYTATMEQVKANLVTLIDPFIRVPLVAFVAVGSLAFINLAYAYVSASIGVVLVALFFLFRDRIKLRRPTLFRSYLSFAAPLVLVTIIGVVSAQLFVDILVTTGGGSYVAAGLYSGCLAMLSIFGLIGTSVATMTFPSFSKMHTNGDLAQIRYLTYQAERYISIIGLPVFAVIVLFPTETAHILLGPSYIGAGDDMRILAVATFLSMINGVHGTQIFALNRPELNAKLTVLSFITGLTLLLVLVPKNLFGFLGAGFSDVGAAIAYLGSVVVVVLATRYIVHRLTRTVPNPRLGIHLFAVLIAAIPVYAFGLIIPITSWYHLVIEGLIGYAVFAAVLYLGNELDRRDLLYFLDLLNLRKMWGYIREELGNKRPKQE